MFTLPRTTVPKPYAASSTVRVPKKLLSVSPSVNASGREYSDESPTMSRKSDIWYNGRRMSCGVTRVKPSSASSIATPGPISRVTVVEPLSSS